MGRGNGGSGRRTRVLVEQPPLHGPVRLDPSRVAVGPVRPVRRDVDPPGAGQGELVPARLAAGALLSNGRYADAAAVVSRGADGLSAHALPDNELRWSLLGSLYLVGAMATARADNPRGARSFLARARQAGQQLGHDANHAWTAFGPTNVAVHDLSVAVELGDLQTAVTIAPKINAAALPVERRVRHALEVANVYAMSGRDDEGLAAVLHAERDAPSRSSTTSLPGS